MRAVKQLVVLASVRVVVVLCNGLATVHALDTLAQLCVLNNAETKAEALCCNCDERLPRVVLLVAAQSSLLFYRLANPVVLYRELPVRTPPSTMTWQGDALSLAHPTGVTVIDANVGHTLFEQGFAQESRLCAAYENQRWVPLKGWGQTLLPGDMCGQWCDAAFSKVESLDAVALPAGGASWASPSSLDLAGAHDPEGWRYARDFNFSEWRQENLRSCVVRRRKWIRGYVADAGVAADERRRRGRHRAAAAGGVVTRRFLLRRRRRRRPTARRLPPPPPPPPPAPPSGKEAARTGVASQPSVLALAPGRTSGEGSAAAAEAALRSSSCRAPPTTAGCRRHRGEPSRRRAAAAARAARGDDAVADTARDVMADRRAHRAAVGRTAPRSDLPARTCKTASTRSATTRAASPPATSRQRRRRRSSSTSACGSNALLAVGESVCRVPLMPAASLLAHADGLRELSLGGVAVGGEAEAAARRGRLREFARSLLEPAAAMPVAALLHHLLPRAQAEVDAAAASAVEWARVGEMLSADLGDGSEAVARARGRRWRRRRRRRTRS